MYQRAVNLVPHNEFPFAKLWIQYGTFLVRQKELVKARQVFGNSIGRCPRPKVFKAYAELEMQLGEIERCRKIFEKQVDLF